MISYVLVLTIMAGVSAYLFVPVFHWIKYGFILYKNGEDEAVYLNYFFASKSVGIGRLAEYPVMLLHNIGLNGGLINLVFDSLSLIAIPLFTYKLLKCAFPRANWEVLLYSLILILFLPLPLSSQNPVVSHIINAVSNDGLLRNYFVWNHSPYPVYLRTPESQTSLAIFVLSLWLSMRYKSPLIVLLVLPFLYFFVSLYVATIFSVYYIALFVENRFSALGTTSAVAVSSLITLVLSGIGLYFLYVLKGDMVVATHLPVFGLSMLWMFLSFIACKWTFHSTKLTAANQRFIISLMTGTLVLYNTQIISGGIIQPQHFEFELCLVPGIIISVFVLSAFELWTRVQKVFIAALYTTCILSIGKYGMLDFGRINNKIRDFSILLEKSNIRKDLMTCPELVAINDIQMSTLVSGFYLNKGKPLISSAHYAFIEGESYYDNYIAFENFVKTQDDSSLSKMKPLTDQLDQCYNGLAENFLPLYVSRRGLVFKHHDSSKAIYEKQFKLYFIE